MGTWMQRTAVYWVVYELTSSSMMVGLAVFATQFPSFIFSIIGGVFSDRYDRFKILVTTQLASLIQAVILTAIVWTGHYEVWHILTLSILLGTINAFDVPARQALVYDMVDNKEHLPNAIALNSSMVHTARLIGPALSGIVLEHLGAATCFLINALSFVAVLISLVFMKLSPHKKSERMNKALTDLKNGFLYLRDTPAISKVMLMLALVSLLSLPYITLLPVYARDIFSGTASTFGYLNSLVGIGALGGAFMLASLKPGADLKKILFINTLVFGAGLIAFSHMTNLHLAWPFLIMAGFGMMSQTTISNTLIQTTVTPSMRGRVLSYYAMAFFGMQPIGSLMIGSLAQHIGQDNTMLLQGLFTLGIALIFLPFLRRREMKPTDKIKMEQLEEGSVEAS
jgi:MFS family permease